MICGNPIIICYVQGETAMKKLLHFPLILVILLIFGCAKQYPVVPTSWKTLSEFNVPYEKAWSTVIDVITEKNIKLDVVQKDAGYIKSTQMFWNGQSFTLSVKFYEKSPVIIKLQAVGTLYNNWTGAPIDTGVPSLEKVIIDEIEGRLKKLPTLSENEIKKNIESDETSNKEEKIDTTKKKLIKLNELFKDGLISKEEYNNERKKILNDL